MDKGSTAPGAHRKLPPWQPIATVVAAFLAVVVLLAVINGARDSDSIGQTSVATPVPTEVASQAPQPSIIGGGLTEAEAVAAARVAAPQAVTWDLRAAQSGPFGDVFPAMDEFDWSRDISPDRWVWLVSLGIGEPLDSQGSFVILDFADGTIYQVVNTRG